jgi:polyisoprenoid-binding protein YceI
MLISKWPVYALAPLIILIAGCTHVPAPAAAPPVAAGPENPPAVRPAGAVDYRVDPAHSTMRMLVYRGGALASLGHNHIILDNKLSGWIRAAKSAGDSSFYLQLSPADFLVDQPAARAQEGADFAEAVDDAARTGTRHNMLGAALLDADRFPLIQIESVSVQGSEPEGGSALTAALKITIAGHTHPVSASFTLGREAKSLQVTADFWLRQSTLALTPFSALLGGLQVADDLHLKLDVVATTDQAAGPG